MIIVGNGPSIIDEKLGGKIDSFESVVRFNAYVTDFPEYSGTKTTHWWNTVNFQNPKHPLLQGNYEEVCLHSWQFREDKDQLWQRQKNLIRAQKIFKSSESWIFELQQYGGTKYYGFSTGLLAIWYYLKIEDSLTIVGFDWWQDRERHHPWDSAIRGELHKPQEEKKIIDKLVQSGRVKFL